MYGAASARQGAKLGQSSKSIIDSVPSASTTQSPPYTTTPRTSAALSHMLRRLPASNPDRLFSLAFGAKQ